MSMYSAARMYDERMVRRYCEDNDLVFAVPTDPPDAITVDEVVLLVDVHSWGKVCFAENLRDDVACTWIERNDVRPTLPPWAEAVRFMVDRPNCLGFHEEDHVCDGGVNPDTGQLERACRWRSVCMKVQEMVDDPAKIDRFLDARVDSELWKLVEDRPKVRRRRTHDGEQRMTNDENQVASEELVQLVFERVCELGRWEIAEARHRATNGQFYLIRYEMTGKDGEPAPPDFVMYQRRPCSWTGELKNDPGTERAVMKIGAHRRNPHVTIEVNTDEVDMVREVVEPAGLRVTQTVNPSGGLASRRERERYIARIIDVREDTLDVVAQVVVGVVEGGFLNTWGAGATDPDKPGYGIGRWRHAGRQFKDPTVYNEKRRKFLEALTAAGWVPGKRPATGRF